MKKCRHENLQFLGRQQKGVLDKFVYIFHCLDCKSTVTIPTLQAIRLINIVKDK